MSSSSSSSSSGSSSGDGAAASEHINSEGQPAEPNAVDVPTFLPHFYEIVAAYAWDILDVNEDGWLGFSRKRVF